MLQISEINADLQAYYSKINVTIYVQRVLRFDGSKNFFLLYPKLAGLRNLQALILLSFK